MLNSMRKCDVRLIYVLTKILFPNFSYIVSDILIYEFYEKFGEIKLK